ncbi:MAG: DUF5317 family protein [Actinomycetota bacterium]|nr:DUF5317 family protein [Actinomycetota bacterium]
MILLVSVVLASIGLGYVLGGRLSGFERFRLRWWPLAFLGLALQLAPVPAGLATASLIVSYVFLLMFTAANVRAPGVPLILIGLALNLAVITPNGGMPVSKDALVRSGQVSTLEDLRNGGGVKHHLEGPGDVLTPLADIIAIGAPFDQVASVGDAFVYAGLIWLVVAVMRGARRADPAPRWMAYQGKHRPPA